MFVNLVTDTIKGKKTRRGDEIDLILKSIWSEWKDKLTVHKVACRLFCIQVHEAFTIELNKEPSGWYFLQSEFFVGCYHYQKAISNCTP